MPLKAVSFAAYLTTDDAPWRDADYCASMFVKAIKARPFRGYGWIPVCGKSYRLTQENSDDAIRWFGDIAADYLKGKLPDQVTLVPVPNSGCTVESTAVPRTFLLAQSINTRVSGVKLWDGLRWKKPMMPSSQGGTRDPYELYENLVATKTVPTDYIVLVDDVRTKGAHLIATKARLAEKGCDGFLAVCAGRTVLAQEKSPFSTVEDELPDLAFDVK
jgi:hypothetical protein